jgi:two-component system, sensor histidine kinase
MIRSDDLSPETFLLRIDQQKRVFLLILAPMVMATSVTHTIVRWNAGLKLAGIFGGFLFFGALISIPLAWRRKITTAAHLILLAALLSTSLNQYAMASASIGPVLNIFSIFMAAMYLLPPRWGIFYGIIGFCRTVILKALQDTGVFSAPAMPIPGSDWYSSLLAAFLVFGYLLVAMVYNYRLLLESYRQAAVARQKFLAKMSHEIRTPLNALLGIGEILSTRIVDSEKQKYMSTILSAGRSMLQIANQALEVARREGKQNSKQRVYDPAVLMKELATLFEAEAQGKKILINVFIEKQVPADVMGDVVAVREIITNFLHNALKFTSHGTIHLSVSRETAGAASWLVYAVSDTGRGIAREKLQTIFEAFDQGGTATEASAGVGLGLSICQELSAQMGGVISAESREGEGSTFRVRVPLVARTMPAASQHGDEEKITPTRIAGARKILSVDDDAMNQMLIRAYLNSAETQLTTVDSGEKAVVACAEDIYDLVLMDLHMPEVDGFEALRRIRVAESDSRRQPVPVIAVTASIMPEEIARVQEAGFIMHLAKPLSQDDLFRAIAAVAK